MIKLDHIETKIHFRKNHDNDTELIPLIPFTKPENNLFSTRSECCNFNAVLTDFGIDFLKWRFTHWIIYFKIDRYFAQKKISNNQNLENFITSFIINRIPDKVSKLKSLKMKNLDKYGHYINIEKIEVFLI